MTLKRAFIFAAALGTISCGTSSDNSDGTADATGTYVREYVIEITNPETGMKIGMRQVRDSIFVQRSENGYQVSNRKWRMNDYDQEGWVSMAHAEDRPLPTFFASYDHKLGALKPENSGLLEPIVIEKGKLFRGAKNENAYRKVE